MKKYYNLSLAILILFNSISFNLCHDVRSPIAGMDPIAMFENSIGIKPTNDIIDEFAMRVFPFFDEIPDNPVAIAKYCVEFIPLGLGCVAWTNIRFPHLLLLKAMTTSTAVGILTAASGICLNPLTQLAFISKGRRVNEEKTAIIALHKEMRARMVNINNAFKSKSVEDMQKNMCCVWLNWKLAVIDLLGKELGKWYVGIVDTYFSLTQMVFCQQYQDSRFDELCADIDFEKFDKKPKGPLAKHIVTACLDAITNFI